MYANLPPDDTASSNSSSGSADGEFNRCAAAQLANIHSELLLAVYDDDSEDDEDEQKPAAVFELSLHEENVDFAPAVDILTEVAEVRAVQQSDCATVCPCTHRET